MYVIFDEEKEQRINNFSNDLNNTNFKLDS